MEIYNQISEIINYYINNPKEFLLILLENPIIKVSLAIMMTICIFSLYSSISKEND